MLLCLFSWRVCVVGVSLSIDCFALLCDGLMVFVCDCDWFGDGWFFVIGIFFVFFFSLGLVYCIA